ncbi:hypothetical protein [Nocardia sp.]|uniref:hypothetical protein n=1 Tax=Nocardia sp. TaxID=1821 RepID=UPI0025906216|nr:hypothetical protein [Nocardia sp.]
MRARIVYESLYGNTAAIAGAVAAGMGRYGKVEVMNVVMAGEQPECAVDLLVVGAPTHLFGMSRPHARRVAARRTSAPVVTDVGIREWLAAAHPPRPHAHAAVFDTHVAHSAHIPGSAARSIAKRLQRLGYHLVDDPIEFLLDDLTGPVSPGELARARGWAQRLAATELDRIAHHV